MRLRLRIGCRRLSARSRWCPTRGTSMTWQVTEQGNRPAAVKHPAAASRTRRSSPSASRSANKQCPPSTRSTSATSPARGNWYLRSLEGRCAPVPRNRHQHRRALLRHAALHLRRNCSETACTCRNDYQGRRLPGGTSMPGALVPVGGHRRLAPRSERGRKEHLPLDHLDGDEIEFSGASPTSATVATRMSSTAGAMASKIPATAMQHGGHHPQPGAEPRPGWRGASVPGASAGPSRAAGADRGNP